MEKQGSIFRPILIVAVITGILLLVPLVAMQFTDQVVWTAVDFIVMGLLLFTIGCSFVIATRRAPNTLYKIAMALGLGATLFMIWVNLAVGIIGSGPHFGNWMYVLVVVVGLVGTLRSRLQAKGMEQTMYAMALTLFFIAGVALMMGMDQYSGSSLMEILGVTVFLSSPFAIAGVLFRYAGEEKSGAVVQ